jgi:hypothetical protein
MPINFPPGTGKYLTNSGVRVSLEQTWDKRGEGWDSHVISAAAFGEVRDRLLRAARPAPGDACAWWRMTRNIARYGLRTGHEHPATPGFWQAALRDAGFAGVTFEPVIAEAGIVSAVVPSSRG